MKSSRAVRTSSRIIEIPKAWAERGETTIRTISKQRTGGVTATKDQPEWLIDGPAVEITASEKFEPRRVGKG